MRVYRLLVPALIAVSACSEEYAPPRLIMQQGRDTVIDCAAQLPPAEIQRAARALEERTRGELSLAYGTSRDECWSYFGDRPVFMSSVVKLPVALTVLRRVDRNESSMTDSIRIEPSQFSPGHRPMADKYKEGATLTIAELLRWAVSDSDNTANNVLLHYVGGPSAVNNELRALGVGDHIRVDRDYFGYARDASASIEEFTNDHRDRATALGMFDLLLAIRTDSTLSNTSRRYLDSLMTYTRNPAGRIVAGMWHGSRIAHKTGTWGNDTMTVAVNDVGYFKMDEFKEEFYIAMMIRKARAPVTDTERAMADLTEWIVSDVAGSHRRKPR